jgi:hypothetical protein
MVWTRPGENCNDGGYLRRFFSPIVTPLWLKIHSGRTAARQPAASSGIDEGLLLLTDLERLNRRSREAPVAAARAPGVAESPGPCASDDSMKCRGRRSGLHRRNSSRRWVWSPWQIRRLGHICLRNNKRDEVVNPSPVLYIPSNRVELVREKGRPQIQCQI